MGTSPASFVLGFQTPSIMSSASHRPGWAAAIATLAAWPSAEPTQPVIERRLWRPGARGQLRQDVLAGLRDYLGTLDPHDAERDLHELMRPLRDCIGLRRMSDRRRQELETASYPYVCELRLLSGLMPEGPSALPVLFADLVCGLAALPGPVALSMVVASAGSTSVPASGDAEDPEPVDDSRPPDLRRVRFRLRLCAHQPLPVALRARAEALCLSHRPQSASWRSPVSVEEARSMRVAMRTGTLAAWGGEDDPLVRVDAAAMTLALEVAPPRGTRAAVEGVPVGGKLPTSGAALGRVRRTDGRTAGWRLSWEARRLHTFVAGSSGCGKTTTLLRLARDDIEAGRTVILLDPHGDLSEEVAALAPPESSVMIDPRYPSTGGLDLLDRDPARATGHLMGAVNEVWPVEFSGPVWQRAISLTLRTLASRRPREATTLADVERFLVDADWRDGVIATVDDGIAQEAAHESRAWRRDSAGDSSLVNWMAGKLIPMTQGPAAPLFAVAASRRLEDDIAAGGAIIVTLPLGLLGSDTVGLVGRMFLTRLTTAVAAQGSRPVDRRAPISILIDEAHLVAGPALSGLFAQARKFGASVTVATQSPGQLGDQLSAVLTNAQTLLLGRLPVQETIGLRARLGDGTITALATLPKHHLIVATEDAGPTAPPLLLTPVPLTAPARRDQVEARRRRELMPRLGRALREVQARRSVGEAGRPSAPPSAPDPAGSGRLAVRNPAGRRRTAP